MQSEVNFESLGLSAPILKAVKELGYKVPTSVQSKAIPAVIKGNDLLASAQTGTGKTAAFILPLLEILLAGETAKANQVRALILVPTRELACQIGDSLKAYSAYLSLRSAVVYGGVKINPQMMKLRKGVDVLVATPGRLLDLYSQNALKFNSLQVLVLDEADKMLNMGFKQELEEILSVLPVRRQNLLFSATFSDEIRKLAKGILHKPLEFSVTPVNTAAKTVRQWICPVDKKKKPALLGYLYKSNNWKQLLVFCKTKIGADKLTRYIQKEGIKVAAIHGDKSQSLRAKALSDFRREEIQILVATDIAARGLDIEQLPQVVNFDLPKVAEDYIHRIGRTGRAGLNGCAISLVSADEFDLLSNIEHLIKKLLPRKLVDGFEPVHDVPQSKLWRKEKKPKKPKKPKKSTSNNTQEKSQNSTSKKSAKYKEQSKSKRLKNTKKISKNRTTSSNGDGSKPPRRKFKP